MNDNEILKLWFDATPEARDAAWTVLRMIEAGHTMNEAADAIEDDHVRALAKQYVAENA